MTIRYSTEATIKPGGLNNGQLSVKLANSPTADPPIQVLLSELTADGGYKEILDALIAADLSVPL